MPCFSCCWDQSECTDDVLPSDEHAPAWFDHHNCLECSWNSLAPLHATKKDCDNISNDTLQTVWLDVKEPQYGIQQIWGFGIRNPERGIRNPLYGIQNPRSILVESVSLESQIHDLGCAGIWNPESDCQPPGFLYIRQTVYIAVSTISHINSYQLKHSPLFFKFESTVQPINFPVNNWVKGWRDTLSWEQNEPTKLTYSQRCGFIAQLPENFTGVADITGSNPTGAPGVYNRH